jgi:hypothetical protein
MDKHINGLVGRKTDRQTDNRETNYKMDRQFGGWMIGQNRTEQDRRLDGWPDSQMNR